MGLASGWWDSLLGYHSVEEYPGVWRCGAAVRAGGAVVELAGEVVAVCGKVCGRADGASYGGIK